MCRFRRVFCRPPVSSSVGVAKVVLKQNPDIAQRIETAIRQNAGLIAEKILVGEQGESGDDDDEADDEQQHLVGGQSLLPGRHRYSLHLAAWYCPPPARRVAGGW